MPLHWWRVHHVQTGSNSGWPPGNGILCHRHHPPDLEAKARHASVVVCWWCCRCWQAIPSARTMGQDQWTWHSIWILSKCNQISHLGEGKPPKRSLWYFWRDAPPNYHQWNGVPGWIYRKLTVCKGFHCQSGARVDQKCWSSLWNTTMSSPSCSRSTDMWPGWQVDVPHVSHKWWWW